MACSIRTQYYKNIETYCKENHLITPDALFNYDPSAEWVDLSPFFSYCASLSEKYLEDLIHVRQFGRVIMDTMFLDPPLEIPPAVIQGVLSLPRFYGVMVQGDSPGLIKVEKVDAGHFVVLENTPFEEDFIIGMLLSFLKNLGGRGIGAALVHSKGQGDFFAKYKITWLQKAAYEPPLRIKKLK